RAATERGQTLVERLPCVAQEPHVVERVVERRARQRPAAPVRARKAFAELDADEAREQVLKPDLRREAEQARGDLRIDEPRRQAPRSLPDDLEILARAVNEPGRGRAEERAVKRLEVEGCQAVDGCDRVRGRELHEAELRVIGLLADELRVD